MTCQHSHTDTYNALFYDKIATNGHRALAPFPVVVDNRRTALIRLSLKIIESQAANENLM